MRLSANKVLIFGRINPILLVALTIFCILPMVLGDVICSDSCWCDNIDGKPVTVCIGQNLTLIPQYFDKRLQEIVLMFNNISAIQNYVFHGLSNVSIMILQHNEIKELYERAFDGLYKLIFLDLAYNKISKIPPKIIQNNEKLKFLYLNHNEISISGPFLISNTLSILDISFCKITFLPHDAFIGTPNLVKLKINNNLITEFEKYAFRGLRKLEILISGNNKIQKLDSILFLGLEELQYLDFSNNNISISSPRTFENNRKLQYLFLQNNNLSIYRSGPILVSNSLSHLDISFCNITFIPPEAFIHLTNLNTLRMIGNPFSNLDTETMKPLTKLQVVLLGPESSCSGLSFQNVFEYFKEKSVVYYAPPICTTDSTITHSVTFFSFPTTTETPREIQNVTVFNVNFYDTHHPALNKSSYKKFSIYVIHDYIVLSITSFILVCR